MNHAITLGDVLGFLAIPVGLFVICGVLFGIIWLFNPFRSGH